MGYFFTVEFLPVFVNKNAKTKAPNIFEILS
jgi:hypothetical protein